MAVTITIVDNSDGTGTVTITGSAGGSTNRVYTSSNPGTTTTLAGTRTGDGTVTITLAAGYYLGFVTSNTLILSNVVSFYLTSAASGNPVDTDLVSVLNAVIARLQSQVTLPDGATLLNDDTCFLWLVDGEPPPPSASNVFLTVEPDGGQYDEGMMIGGGTAQVMEMTGVAVTIHSSSRLDTGMRDKQFLVNTSFGIVAMGKKVLQALTCHNLLVSGSPVLGEYMQPTGRSRPSRRADDKFGDMTIVFSLSFDWNLT